MDRLDYDEQFELTADPPPMEAVRVGMIYEKLPIMDIQATSGHLRHFPWHNV